jgi:hypothetical protein
MYFTVSVKTSFEDNKGKVKTKTEKYLVDAMTVTEAESRVVSFMEDAQLEYEISAASVSRIVEVITPQTTPSVYGK